MMLVDKWFGILLDVVTVIAATALAAVACSFVLWLAVTVIRIIWAWTLP